MAHAPQSIDEIVAAQAYIHAKLRKFELDQVTQPFAHTASRQGLGRAVRGALQRGALKAAGKIIRFAPAPGSDAPRGPYERYVEHAASEIESERARVAAFEATHGDSFARDLYHKIRDAPESSVPTYKASRVVFRKLTRDLERARAKQSVNPLEKLWRNAAAWVTYGDRELKAIAIGTGLALGAGIMVPVHRINEWNDHHRPIAHVKYDHINAHPMTEMAISAHEFEMYLHTVWNNAGGDETRTANWVAQEYRDFIKKNDYNKRYTDSDAGSDWTRPVLDLFEEARGDSATYLEPVARPVSVIAQGRNEIARSWDHYSHDNTHTESYECGTTDDPETCTRTVCDSTDHTFTLDRSQLVKGAVLVRDGAVAANALLSAKRAPGKLSPAQYREFLVGPKEIPAAHMIGAERLKEELELYNRWSRSVMITQHDAMLGGINALANSPVPQQLVTGAGSYPKVYHNNNPFCGPPLSYPPGWSEHTQAIAQASGVTDPYATIQESRGEFSKAYGKIESAMQRLEKSNDVDITHTALRELGDLAWEVHNANYNGESWHPTHGTRLFLEWLGFMGIAGAAFGGAFGLFNKYRHTRTVRKLYENGVAPETVNPWRNGYRRF